jgi:hypothetical protein
MFVFLIAAVLAVFDSGMSVQEMKETGVSRLSAKEKMALDTWIESNYSKKLVAQNSSKKAPVLEENLKNGHMIRLSDNSLWEINPSDTPITQGWITPVEIIVTASKDPAYPYNLKNSLTGSTVRARKPQAAATPATPKPTPPKTGY